MDKIDLKNLNNTQLIALYPNLLKELKNRGIIRTNNLIGELGEHLAVNEYNNNKKLPNLQLCLIVTTNIDATDLNGKRYAIKSSSNSTTGLFSSIPTDDDKTIFFEFLIVVLFNKDCTLKRIFELTWDQFVMYRTLKSSQKKWYLNLTQKVMKNIKLVK